MSTFYVVHLQGCLENCTRFAHAFACLFLDDSRKPHTHTPTLLFVRFECFKFIYIYKFERYFSARRLEPARVTHTKNSHKTAEIKASPTLGARSQQDSSDFCALRENALRYR